MSVTADRRRVTLAVEQERRGRRTIWVGVLAIDGRQTVEAEGFYRGRVLADLLDGMLARGVDVEPCCALDGKGQH